MSDLEQYYLDEEKKREDANWEVTHNDFKVYLDIIAQASAFILEKYKQNPSQINELHEWINVNVGQFEKKKCLVWLFVFCLSYPLNSQPKRNFYYYLAEDGKLYYEFLPDMFKPIDIESLKSERIDADTKNIYFGAASVMISAASKYGAYVANWKESIELSYYGNTIENVHKSNVIGGIGFLSIFVGASFLLFFIGDIKEDNAYISGIIFLICAIIAVICYIIDSKIK